MNRKIAIIIAAAIIIGGFALLMMLGSMEKEKKPPRTFEKMKYVRIDTVRYRTYKALVTAYGRLRAVDRVEIFSEVSGILENTKPQFRVGNTFKKGQIMLKIDDREARMSLFSKKSDFLKLLASMMPDIIAEFPGSADKWDAYLKKTDIKKDLPELPEPDSDKERYFLAGRNVLSMYYNISNLELRLDKHSIVAPFDGVVTESNIDPGTLVRIGSRLGGFAGTGSYELELSVREQDANFLSTGDIAFVSPEGGGTRRQGRIIRIGKHIDTGTQTVKVFIMLSGSELKDGMYLKAEIGGDPVENVFRIPRNALINNKYIHFSNKGKLDRTETDVVRIGENYAYIRGIDSLIQVVVEPLVNTALGTKIKPIN